MIDEVGRWGPLFPTAGSHPVLSFIAFSWCSWVAQASQMFYWIQIPVSHLLSVHWPCSEGAGLWVEQDLLPGARSHQLLVFTLSSNLRTHSVFPSFGTVVGLGYFTCSVSEKIQSLSFCHVWSCTGSPPSASLFDHTNLPLVHTFCKQGDRHPHPRLQWEAQGIPAAPALQSCILLRNLVLVGTSDVPGVAAPLGAVEHALWHGTTVAERGTLSSAEVLAHFYMPFCTEGCTDCWANTFCAETQLLVGHSTVQLSLVRLSSGSWQPPG